MRYAKPAAAGLLPLAAGYVFDFAILHLPAFFPLYFIVQLALLIGWGALAYKLSKDVPATACAALMCAFGLAMLALDLYQELVLNSYWLNIAGFAPQMYFLTLLTLFSRIMTPFMSVIEAWPIYTAELAALFASALAGALLRRRREKYL